jgi:hypothetical protein
MKAVAHDPDVSSPTALAYETTEEARLLLGCGNSELLQARAAAGEAAYYLSDTIEPDDRTSLLALAERRSKTLLPGGEREQQHEGEMRATEALTLLADAAGEVEQMLRGPNASSELRIALQALRGGIGSLASHFDLATDRLNVNSLRSQRLSVLRRLGAKRR